MRHQPIQALLWPVDSAGWDHRRMILALPTAMDSPRERTRLQVRRVVREVLGRHLAIASEQVVLQSRPGHPPQLAVPLHKTGLSFAHEAGLSLVAIRLDGPVGVDLMHRHQVPDDWQALARDYLGPRIAAQLGVLSPENGACAFAHAWVSLEARLKCLGFPLNEWRRETADRLDACHEAPVVLPEGWIGALAWP